MVAHRVVEIDLSLVSGRHASGKLVPVHKRQYASNVGYECPPLRKQDVSVPCYVGRPRIYLPTLWGNIARGSP